jgi:hypothetical protein
MVFGVGESGQRRRGVMKLRGITFISGFIITMIGSVLLWQLLVVALLVRGIDDVIGALARLL